MPEAKEDLVELEQEDAVEVAVEEDTSVASVIEEDVSRESEELSEDITEEELASYSTGVRKRIDKLTAKYREAERREQAALQYAKGVIAQKDEVTKSAQQWSDNANQQYAGRITTDLEAAKKRYVQAYESGDPDELVNATTDLSKLTVENAALNNEITALRPQQPVLQTPQTPATAPPPDPKSQAWATRNEWFGADEPMTYTAFAIHKNLVETGFDPSSDTYYSEIDRRIREEFPHKFGETPTQPATNGRSSPVQRVASANRAAKTTGRGTVKLTPSQVAIAKKLGVPLEDYARQVKEINAHV
tara:strand:- start:960 stop:1868 length:909 start_codon:yes stop_codon:yes gene_type:complete